MKQPAPWDRDATAREIYNRAVTRLRLRYAAEEERRGIRRSEVNSTAAMHHRERVRAATQRVTESLLARPRLRVPMVQIALHRERSRS